MREKEYAKSPKVTRQNLYRHTKSDGNSENGRTTNMSQQYIFGLDTEDQVSNTAQDTSKFEHCGNSK